MFEGIGGCKAFLIPGISGPSSSIESRGLYFKQQIERFRKKNPQYKKFHLVGCSFAGVDLRSMLSFHDYKEHFVSLTTLSSPHNGLTIFDRNPIKYMVFEEGLLERPL